jgi:hypothetical protein
MQGHIRVTGAGGAAVVQHGAPRSMGNVQYAHLPRLHLKRRRDHLLNVVRGTFDVLSVAHLILLACVHRTQGPMADVTPTATLATRTRDEAVPMGVRTHARRIR